MARRRDCVDFLRWCLPKMHMWWPGFRKVRTQVCKRLGRRLRELGLENLEGYRRYLDTHPDEWRRLDSMCRITISRFYRDRRVFEALETEVLPALASTVLERGDDTLRCWSCGCASGEEAYTLAILWQLRVVARVSKVLLDITATDADEALLDRARRGCFSDGSLRELPDDLRCGGLESDGDLLRVRDHFRAGVSWCHQDVRIETPEGLFDLILCRNLVLTYYDESMRREVMERAVKTLQPGGALVIGSHESLPLLETDIEPWQKNIPIYRRVADRDRVTLKP